MNLLFGLALALLVALLGLVMFGSGYAASWIGSRVRRLPVVRRVPLLGVRPSLPPLPTREEGSDLLAYPRRLETLQDRLVERHRAVQGQLQLLSARREGVRDLRQAGWWPAPG